MNIDFEGPDDGLTDLLRALKASEPCPLTREELAAGFAAAMEMAAAADTDPALAAKLDRFVEPALAELAERNRDSEPNRGSNNGDRNDDASRPVNTRPAHTRPAKASVPGQSAQPRTRTQSRRIAACYDLAKGFAAARREGWTQAIEALRALIREISEDDDMHDPKTSYPNCLGCKWRTTLTDRAAALTEEVQS